MQVSQLEYKKAGDVARLSQVLRKAVGCGVCALGIACDLVERHWHDGAHDFRAEGHTCRLVEKGLTPAEVSAVEKIQAEYLGKERRP